MCPLFKRGDKVLACNYLPVSMTYVSCKLLEHIVYSNIKVHVAEYQLVSYRQHTFRKTHNCDTELAIVVNNWVYSLDKGGKLTRLFWTLIGLLTQPLMNYLKANYLEMALAERPSDE